MKTAFQLLVLTLVVSGVIAWVLCRDSQQEDEKLWEADFNTAPAEYPADMWGQLQQIEGIEISQSSAALPDDLNWENGMGEVEIGDPRALKGGQVSLCNVGPFPAHFRAFGGMPEFFHYTLYDQVRIPLVGLHPNNNTLIPGLAQSWAVQGRTIFYRLQPQARYSNGRPLRAADFVFSIYMRSNPHVQNAFFMARVREVIESICIYGDDCFSITMRAGSSSLLAPYYAASCLYADEPSFYAEFGTDFLERYAQRIPPTLGAYSLKSDDIVRGRSITMSRVPNWWAQDLPYYRYRYNVERVEHQFLTEEAQAWEFFLRGKLDLMQTRNLSAWEQNLNGDDVRAGRIEKHRFDTHYPLPHYGVYFNTQRVADINLRRGLMAAMDMKSAIDLIFRGEGQMLSCFSDGYGALSPTEIEQASYNPQKARRFFAAAGYTQQADDGILCKPDGTRLSLALCFVPSDKVSSLCNRLAQSAAAAGAELRLEPMTWKQNSDAVHQRNYELSFWADVASFPMPRHDKNFNSAFAEAGDENPFALRDDVMDALLARAQDAANMEDLALATKLINERVYELAIWLPGWKESRAYVANWRRVRFPDTPDCRFSTPAPYDVTEAHLFWVDDKNFSNKGVFEELDQLYPAY